MAEQRPLRFRPINGHPFAGWSKFLDEIRPPTVLATDEAAQGRTHLTIFPHRTVENIIQWLEKEGDNTAKMDVLEFHYRVKQDIACPMQVLAENPPCYALGPAKDAMWKVANALGDYLLVEEPVRRTGLENTAPPSSTNAVAFIREVLPLLRGLADAVPPDETIVFKRSDDFIDRLPRARNGESESWRAEKVDSAGRKMSEAIAAYEAHTESMPAEDSREYKDWLAKCGSLYSVIMSAWGNKVDAILDRASLDK